MFGIFKPKITKENSRDVLAEALACLFRRGGGALRELFLDALGSKLGVKIPSEALDILPIDVSAEIAKALVKRISTDTAYEILKEMKGVLDRYRI